MTCSRAAIKIELVTREPIIPKPQYGKYFFFQKEATRTVFSLAYLLFTKLWSLPSRKGLWVIAFTEVKEVLESKPQTKRAMEDCACLTVSAYSYCCLNPAVPWLLISQWTRVSADCVGKHLLEAKWGCFVYTSVNCAVWHTQLDPVHLLTTHLPSDFLKGALNAQSFMCMRDVANN